MDGWNVVSRRLHAWLHIDPPTRTPARGDATASNVGSYRSDGNDALYAAERRILDALLSPGMVVVDAGCGDGRVTRHLAARGARVIAADLHLGKLRTLRRLLRHPNVHVVAMDLRAPAIAPGSVDLFILAFNVIDFVFPEAARLKLIEDIERMLKPGGHLLFSSHNPLGTLLSVRGVLSPAGLAWRARYLFSGEVRSRYFRDPSGLLLYQASPELVVAQVRERTRMQCVACTDPSGRLRDARLLRCLSAWPYYLFRAAERDDAG